ncbi:hypothetical protein ACHQM5_016110 [Ranunculus cassubicifolius]
MHVMDRAAHLGASVNNLQIKLSSKHSACSAKDDLVMKHAQVAEEAIAGWEKAEAEAVFLKQELEEALRQRIAAEERILDLDSALKECIHQLRCNQEEQHQRISDAVMHICREHEQEWMLVEEKLGETSKMLSKLDFENSHLSKALQTKENLIEDLRKCKSQVEANLNRLMARVDAEDKSMLRSSDASHRENSDNRNKIMMLEHECERLRLLIQSRLPGTATLEKMRSGVSGKEHDKFNSTIPRLVKNFPSWDSSSRTIDFLTEKLSSLEEENRTLKETINTKNNEVQSLRTTVAQNASSLWSLSKAQATMDLAGSTISHNPSHTSLSENGREDEISCSESWASALITELEHLTSKNPKGAPSPKIVGVSGMNLMDDFVEMERLAKISTDNLYESSNGACVNRLGIDICALPSKTSVHELVPDYHSSSGRKIQEGQLHNLSIGRHPSWIQDIIGLILWQNHATGRNPDEILEEVQNALAHICHSGTRQVGDAKENIGSSRLADPLPLGDHSSVTLPNATQVMNSKKRLQSEASKSICRMIELLGVIAQPCEDNLGSLDNNHFSSSDGYIVRVFQWKSSDLHAVLQRFVRACSDISNGRTSLETFPTELTSAMEWVFNHCFSIQDVSSMRDTVKKHLDWNESESESELGNDSPQMEEIHAKLNEDNRTLKQKLSNMEIVQKNLEEKLQKATEKIEELLIQLQEFESKGMIENQTENTTYLHDDLGVARHELSVSHQNSFALELELDNKICRCQELETTCIELQLQLDSVVNRDSQKHDTDQVDSQLKTDREITAASAKLAECQETILNLGKQLKELAAPMDKVVSTDPAPDTKNKNASSRCSLLDQMLSEDNANSEKLMEKPHIIAMIHHPAKAAASAQSVAIVPSKRCSGVSLLKSIVMRRKRESPKKSLTMVT